MNHLVPCPECSRHVRVSEPECPFCSQPLDLSGTPEPRLPGVRLSRAATLAFGATFASATALAACSGPDAPVPVYGAAAPAGGSANLAGAAGAPAAGTPAAGAPAGGADSGIGGGAVPVYGAPAPTGGSANLAGAGGAPAAGAPTGGAGSGIGGGAVAVYGAPAGGEFGTGTAGSGIGGGAGPVYGAPP